MPAPPAPLLHQEGSRYASGMESRETRGGIGKSTMLLCASLDTCPNVLRYTNGGFLGAFPFYRHTYLGSAPNKNKVINLKTIDLTFSGSAGK